MNKIFGLPKSAIITSDGQKSDLVIENHKVVNEVGFTDWVISSLLCHDDWDNVLRQLMEQEIKFAVFVELCIEELKDNEKLQWVLAWYDESPELMSRANELAYSKVGAELASDIIRTIQKCNSWNQFGKTMGKEGKFYENMKNKIKEEVKQWLE